MKKTENNATAIIAIVGSFNPAIFQPAWIQSNFLLLDEEMEGFYKDEIVKDIPEYGIKIGQGQPFQVSNDYASLAFKSFSLEVTRNRLLAVILSGKEATPIKFLLKVFKILMETPIKSYGINFDINHSYTEDYSIIIDKLFERKKSFIDSFGEDVELGFTFKKFFNDFKVTNRIELSSKIENGLHLSSNFHKDLLLGEETFNEVDLKSEYDEAKKYYNKMIGNFGKLKKSEKKL